MTLGEGKEKVYKLMDEWSSGGTRTEDADIEAKMAAFFDIGQKDVAQVRHIRRVYALPLEEGATAYPMPSDFLQAVAVWRDGKRSRRYGWRAGEILVPASDTAEAIEIEYYAMPATVDADTPDSYVFEVAEEAANILPFFVASQQLITDLVIDYAGLYALYQERLAMLAQLESTYSGGGGGALTNTLFR